MASEPDTRVPWYRREYSRKQVIVSNVIFWGLLATFLVVGNLYYEEPPEQVAEEALEQNIKDGVMDITQDYRDNSFAI